jgi:ribosomal protein L37AE/L43A
MSPNGTSNAAKLVRADSVQIVDYEAPPGCPACGRQMRHVANFEIYECRECRLFVNEKVRESDVNSEHVELGTFIAC